MKHYIIYKTTNIIDGKFYIGKHVTENLNDGYLGSGVRLINAIKKYGKENFKRETLFELNNEIEITKKEAEIVTEDFCVRPDTYNICCGGYGGDYNITGQKGCSLCEVSRQYWNNLPKDKLKQHNKKMTDGFSRYISNEENKKKWKDNIKKSLVEKYKTCHGKKHSDDTKQKMSISAKLYDKTGIRNPMTGKIFIHNIQTHKNEIWDKNKTIPDGYIKGRYNKEKLYTKINK